MDPKFRVSVPGAWRLEAAGNLYLMASREYDMPVVKVLGDAAFQNRITAVQESPKLTQAEKSRMIGKLASMCRPATVNDQGKLLVPKELSTSIEIEANAEVWLVGRGPHFEIWSKENFHKMREIEAAQEEDDDLSIF
ncbi:MAG: hypothetical protein V4733_02260 [Verrucomicrobiota bacterium]